MSEPAKIVIALILLAALALAIYGCATRVRLVPPKYADCLKNDALPPPPKVPRTIEAIANWADALQAVAAHDAAARDDCARKLHDLNDWIGEDAK